MSAASKAAPWIRGLVDYGAGVAFLAAFLMTRDVMTATKALMVGAAIALAVGLVVERRLAWLPLVTGVAALVFGGLTLLFHDERIIKMKPTILNLAFAATLLGGVALKRNPLKALLGSSLTMPDLAWRILAIRYGLFFILIAIANEAVWRTQPTEVWAWFRFPGLLIATFAFALTQAPLMMRYAKAEDLPTPPPAD
jgi:intracellular septation protein